MEWHGMTRWQVVRELEKRLRRMADLRLKDRPGETFEESRDRSFIAAGMWLAANLLAKRADEMEDEIPTYVVRSTKP